MVQLLRVEITDDRNNDDECWIHDVPIETPMGDIGAAIQTLYPSATGISIYPVEVEE